MLIRHLRCVFKESLVGYDGFKPPPPPGTFIYGLFRYVPRNRVWFLRFSVLEWDIFFDPFVTVFLVWSLDRIANLYYLRQTDRFVYLECYSGAPAAKGRQAEPHTHIRELKGTHEMIFSCVPWLAVLLVGAYARRRRRRRRWWSRATWRPYSNNRLTETCSLGLTCTSLISDIHVMIN